MRMRRAGERRHWLELQAKTDTPTTAGFTTHWATYASGWGAVEPSAAASNSRPVANTTDTPATHVVTCDYVPGVETDHRVFFEGRALHIVGAPQNVEERNVTLVLPCEERAA